jgi:hypothetical protein
MMSVRGAAMRRLDLQAHAGQRARAGAPGGEGDAAAIASYIADMTAQLESMATAAHLDLLGYFLAMARAEGEAAARGGAAGEREDLQSA